jgi:DNA primase
LQTEKIKILKNTLGGYTRQGKELMFHCPKCDHHKNKLSVNLDKNCFKCWVCDYSGRKISRLIRNHGTFFDYKEWRKYDDQIELSDFDKLLEIFEEEGEPTLDLPKEFTSLVGDNILFSSLNARKYLKDRGVSKMDIQKYMMGHCPSGKYQDYVVIPSFNMQGDVNFYVTRNYKGGWPNYLNPRVPKNRIIFNELFIDFHQEITVVEGVFDAIKAGGNSVPLLGSSFSEESKLFQKIVLYDTPVYLALDRDAEAKSIKIIKKLLNYGIEVYKVDTSGFRDVGEMTKEQFKTRKENAMLMDQENTLLYEVLSV